MKANFLNPIISILLILLVIPGILPVIASAIEESLEDGDNSSNSTTQADLIIDKLYTTASPKTNSDAIIYASVSNYGDATSTQTSVFFEVNGTTSQVTLEPIEPGYYRLVSLPWSTPGEEVKVKIAASIEGVDDSRKEITVTIKAKEASLPDLTIANFVPDTSTPQEGQALNFTVSVKNQGTASSNAALATYYIGEVRGQDININALEAGASTNLAFTLTSDQVKSGQMKVRVLADSGNAVNESNENNNAATKTITVSGLLPDLTVESISLNPSTPELGDPVTVTATIRNSGSVASPASNLIFKINGNNETNSSPSISVATLAAGEATQSSYSWTPTKEGNIQITAVIDPDAAISEGDETNNQNTLSATVTQKSSSGGSSSSSSSSSGSSSSSSSSSSSGIGSSFTKEPANNVASKELATRNVVSGNRVRYDFQENSTCVQFMEYDALRTFMKTTTTIEELKNRSVFVSGRPTGGIYKYFNVWVGDKRGGLSTSIANGLIGFRVEKSWIHNNSVNESLITLQLYNNSWESLYTKKVGEDNNYSYFTATVPSYSFFAITEIGGAGNRTEVKLQDTLLGGLESTGKALTGNGTSRAAEAKEASKFLMAIILPLFLIFVIYLVVKKKI